MRPRILLLVAGWLAGAAAAATGVTLALSALGSGLFGTAGPVLSAAQVEQQLAQASPEPSAAATGSQPLHQVGTPGVKNTSGGIVVVRCTNQGALLMATPALGYSADDVLHGPASVVWASFRSDSSEVHVTASCATGEPRITTSSEARGGHGGASPSPGASTAQITVPASGGGDDHGGGGGDHHGGGGSGGTSGGSGGTSGGTSGGSGGSGGGGSNGGGGKGGGSDDG
jgi:hypothetical protein